MPPPTQTHCTLAGQTTGTIALIFDINYPIRARFLLLGLRTPTVKETSL